MYDAQTVARFWAKVDKTPNATGCWLWTACVGRRRTTPLFWADGKTMFAQRVAFEIATGREVGRAWLDLSCGNSLCVNPAHMSLHGRQSAYTKRPRKGFADRFWANVNQNGECWIYEARTPDKNWYGRVRRNGKTEFAHRVAYELANGPIPEGTCVLHRCDNPPCVNPAHLFLGTQQDNMADKVAKGRSNPMGRKLKPWQVLAIRREFRAGTTIAELARRYGIAYGNMHKVAHGITWAHLEDDQLAKAA